MVNILIKQNQEAADARKELNEAVLIGMQMLIDMQNEQIEATEREIEARKFKPVRNKTAEAVVIGFMCLSAACVIIGACVYVWNFGL